MFVGHVCVDCCSRANKAAEWEQRQKDAAGEMAAIAKAKEILAEGVKVFLQARAQSREGRVLALY